MGALILAIIWICGLGLMEIGSWLWDNYIAPHNRNKQTEMVLVRGIDLFAPYFGGALANALLASAPPFDYNIPSAFCQALFCRNFTQIPLLKFVQFVH